MGHIVGSDEYWGSQIPRLEDYGVHRRLNVRSVKLVADGKPPSADSIHALNSTMKVRWDHGVRHFWSPTLINPRRAASCS
jgi:hypothetical protein